MFGQNFSDNEYVTKRELEDVLQSYEVYGDGTTMKVDKQSGGTTISCTLPISAPGEEAAAELTPLVTTSYATASDELTISVKNDYFTLLGELDSLQTPHQLLDVNEDYLDTLDYVLDLSSIGVGEKEVSFVKFYEGTGAGGYKGVRWRCEWSDSAGSGTFSTSRQMDWTNSESKSDATGGAFLFKIGVTKSGGEVTISYPYGIPYVGDRYYVQKYPYLQNGAACIFGPNLIIPFQGSTAGAGTEVGTITYSFPGNVDDKIILGWDGNPSNLVGGGSLTVDLFANIGSYADYQVLGYVKVVSGVIKEFTQKADVLRSFGTSYTCTLADATAGSHQLRFTNGILTYAAYTT